MNGAQGRTDSPGANQDAQSAPVGIATGMWRDYQDPMAFGVLYLNKSGDK